MSLVLHGWLVWETVQGPFRLSGKHRNINTRAKGSEGPEKQRTGAILKCHKLLQNDSEFINAAVVNMGSTECAHTMAGEGQRFL